MSRTERDDPMTKFLANWAETKEKIFVALIILIGMCLLAYYLPQMNPLEDPVVLVFMALIAFSNILAILYPKPGTYLSLNFPILFCLMVIRGTVGAMWVLLPGILVFVRRIDFERIMFGISQNAITIYLVGFFIPEKFTKLVLTRDLIWMLIAAFSADFINTILISTYLSLKDGVTWKETFVDLWMYQKTTIMPLFYSTGILMTVCYQAQGILAAILAFIPALGLFYLFNTQIQLKEQTAKANTDHLTKIGNRHALFGWWKKEFPLLQLAKKNLSVLMIDLDDFKRINDSYGHDCGDKVLQQVAETIKSALRSTDRVFRYGGEEFVVLLPNSTVQGAESVANRICELISELKITGVEHEQITVSIGLADLRKDLLDEVEEISDELMRKSDQAMYLAKKQGKNKVCVYS